MEQLERAQRYLQKIRRLYVGVPALWDDRNKYEDDVLSFFIHCHHIRDWIVALNTLGITPAEVDRFSDHHECLCIVRVVGTLRPILQRHSPYGSSI